MAGNILESTMMIRSMDMESLLGLMVGSMMECGRMASKTAKEYIITSKGISDMAAGTMEKE